MREKLIMGLFLFLAAYMFIPWILSRLLGIGVFRKGHIRREVAFTFDDGPDPKYTPLLLDLLSLHNVKATFFVLGSKAEEHPDLIRRIHEAGHQIGVHNYTHLSNWLMTPWGVRKHQINRSADIVEVITGTRPTYYRPPWGVINLGDFFMRKDFKIIFWSIMARDWNSHIGKTQLKRNLLQSITDGSVILLHDSGETIGADRDAPKFMMQALDDVLHNLKERGFQCIRIDEMIEKPRKNPMAILKMSRSKQLLIAVWMLWEKCVIKLLHIVPIDHENQLLKLRVRAYGGNNTIYLNDGEQITKGDRIVELHFDNNLLLKLSADSPSTIHLAIQIIRRTEQLMPLILQMLQNNPNYKDVKGLYGISLIHRGTKKLGFSVIDLPQGAFSFVTQCYLRLLLNVLHPQGRKRVRSKQDVLVPKIIAISRKELINRYIA